MAGAAHTGAADARPVDNLTSCPRRAILGGLGFTALASVPAAAATLGRVVEERASHMNMHTTIRSAAVDTRQWERLMMKLKKADSAERDFDEQVYQPLFAKVEQAAPRPKFWFEIETTRGGTIRHTWSPFRPHEWDDHVSSVFRKKAGEVRDAWFRYVAARERIGLDKAEDEIERRRNVKCDIISELMEMAAPDRSALLWKLEHLFGETARTEEDDGPSYCPEWINGVMLDARRFLGQ